MLLDAFWQTDLPTDGTLLQRRWRQVVPFSQRCLNVFSCIVRLDPCEGLGEMHSNSLPDCR